MSGTGGKETNKGVADVCLMLEGTYPYVRGGVSTWVSQLIHDMPDMTFALFFIGSDPDAAKTQHYDIPKNVLSLDRVFLFDRLPEEEVEPRRTSEKLRHEFYAMAAQFYDSDELKERMRLGWKMADWLLEHPDDFSYGNILEDVEAWNLAVEMYDRSMPDYPFIDYFWTVRFLHLPIWRVVRALRKVPKARLYHSISTGYAGILGALAAHREKAPYLITEHGIYIKERILEITQSEWIYEKQSRYFDMSANWRKLKMAWIDLFQFLGRAGYLSADKILSLYGGNAKLQVEFGAPEEKIEVVPNGIRFERFDEAKELRYQAKAGHYDRHVVGFVGRIVSIKDVKTLLRAANIVRQRYEDAVFHLYGPTDEEPEYFQECMEIVEVLELGSFVHFKGSRRIETIMPEIDVMVLTSISEALPLVILEAFAAEVPVVSTDVGACRELIHGRTGPDKLLGRAGFLTGISQPLETADSLSILLADEDVQRGMGMAGRRRVEKFYSQDDIINRYRDLYKTLKTTEDRPWQE